jgi:hypothetical protein
MKTNKELIKEVKLLREAVEELSRKIIPTQPHICPPCAQPHYPYWQQPYYPYIAPYTTPYTITCNQPNGNSGSLAISGAIGTNTNIKWIKREGTN